MLDSQPCVFRLSAGFPDTKSFNASPTAALTGKALGVLNMGVACGQGFGKDIGGLVICPINFDAAFALHSFAEAIRRQKQFQLGSSELAKLLNCNP